MQHLFKLLKGAGIGTIVGLALFVTSSFLLKDLVDMLEYMTYYWRYSLEFKQGGSDESVRSAEQQSDICIVDIDDRSQEKMGWYARWNRGYHARMLDNLAAKKPGAILFDINFYSPEDANEAARLDALLQSSLSKNPQIGLSPQAHQAILSTIDYDRQLVGATEDAEVVFNAIRLSNMSDYKSSSGSMSSVVEHKTKAQWHRSLHPASALQGFDSLQREAVESKAIIDGIFPELASVSRGIGHINVPPNSDGVIREIPLIYTFGTTGAAYLPLSVRATATLFATPNDEIEFISGRHLDIGTPFKIFRLADGTYKTSYPTVTMPLVQRIIEHADQINQLKEGETLQLSTMVSTYRNEDDVPVAEVYGNVFPLQLIEAMSVVDLKSVLEAPAATNFQLSGGIALIKDSPTDYIITAPFGDGEWWLIESDIKTLSLITPQQLRSVKSKTPQLLYTACSIQRVEGQLRSSIPVLRGETLEQLMMRGKEAIENIVPGRRLDYGSKVKIPLTADNRHIVTYFGRAKQPFNYYSYYDLYNDRIQGSLANKIYLVGSTAASMFDLVNAPMDENYPGVEVHASLVNSFLTQSFIQRFSTFENALIVMFCGLLIGMLCFVFKPQFGMIITVCGALAYVLFALYVFGTQRLWIDMARPLLSIFLTFSAVMAYRYITEERDKKFLHATFKQYLSPELIDQMYSEKKSPSLGGDEGVRTAFFTDIQSFSTFSEKLGSPTRLVELLNEYLTAMTDILLTRYGTLDKYEGDAIIAFFGAPMEMPDHAAAACHTALDMQRKLAELRKKWTSEGDKWPEIVHQMRMRIGLNTGVITTGNMGSAVRMNYTMMGDAVNLAARLESAAKQYGVYTMISQATTDAVGKEFLVRMVDKITVVGKTEPVTVYELIGLASDPDPRYLELLPVYHKGLDLFYARQWQDAIEQLGRAHELEPLRDIAPAQMSPSKKIMQYAQHFQHSPPDKGWDGVMNLSSK